jgi:hypothetical protein
MAGHTGKRGWAVDLGTTSTTHTKDIGLQKEIRSDTNAFPVTTVNSILNVVNLFSIGADKEIRDKNNVNPFIHQVRFHGLQGEIIRVWANIDDGAMREVMSSSIFRKVKHRLGTSLPSSQLLRLANGAIVTSEARWTGKVEVNGVYADVTFEVFDSGGKWDFLFGKTLLETFKAVHDYERDEIKVSGTGGSATLLNQAQTASFTTQTTTPAPICIITEDEQPDPLKDDDSAEVDVGAFKNDVNLFTRLTAPHKKERVQEIL